MKYGVICADPPWSFSDGLTKMRLPVKRSAMSQYSTMTVDEICDLPVADLADPAGCLLALWVPSSLLQDGLKVMEAWGFSLKQTFVWVKMKKRAKNKCTSSDPNDTLAFGMGRLFRQSHELALICTSGKSIYPLLKNHSQRSVSLDERMKHSKKPDALQDRLDVMFPSAQKLELFARRERDGWMCVGNEIDGKDVRDALDEFVDPVDDNNDEYEFVRHVTTGQMLDEMNGLVKKCFDDRELHDVIAEMDGTMCCGCDIDWGGTALWSELKMRRFLIENDENAAIAACDGLRSLG